MILETHLFDTMKEIERLFDSFLMISTEQLLLLKGADGQNDISEGLFCLFEKRQEIIGEINLLTDRLREYEEKAGLSVLNIDEKFGSQSEWIYFNKKQEIIETIKKIANKDEESRESVKKLMQDSRDKIDRARKSKKAYNAYMPKETYSEAWFFDKKK